VVSALVAQMPCIFCEIVARTALAYVVGESDRALAFLDRSPAAAGHTLVIPKEHARDLLDITTGSLGAVLALAKVIARCQVDALKADGVSLFQSTGAAAGQDVFHFHIHMIPRHTGDRLIRPWGGREATEAEQTTMARLLSGF
jgi:histidine triad (HIT) family protein